MPALIVAGYCAILIAASPFLSVVHRTLVHPSTYVAAAVAAVLFFRMLFDRRCRRGIDAANVELRGGKPWPSRSRAKFLDPEWGLFGTRGGTPTLLVIRSILLAEFIVAMLLSGHNGSNVLVLSFAGCAVAMMLSIIHVGLTTPIAGE